jgi:hypothetical protein
VWSFIQSSTTIMKHSSPELALIFDAWRLLKSGSTAQVEAMLLSHVKACNYPTIEDTLSNEWLSTRFHRFLQLEYCAEHLEFIQAVREARQVVDNTIKLNHSDTPCDSSVASNAVLLPTSVPCPASVSVSTSTSSTPSSTPSALGAEVDDREANQLYSRFFQPCELNLSQIEQEAVHQLMRESTEKRAYNNNNNNNNNNDSNNGNHNTMLHIFDMSYHSVLSMLIEPHNRFSRALPTQIEEESAALQSAPQARSPPAQHRAARSNDGASSAIRRFFGNRSDNASHASSSAKDRAKSPPNQRAFRVKSPPNTDDSHGFSHAPAHQQKGKHPQKQQQQQQQQQR